MSGTPEENEHPTTLPCGTCGAPHGIIAEVGECQIHATLAICEGGHLYPLMRGTFWPGSPGRGPSFSSGGEPPEGPEFNCPAGDTCACAESDRAEPALVDDLIAALAERDDAAANEARAAIARWVKGDAYSDVQLAEKLSALLGQPVTRVWTPDLILARHDAARALNDVSGFLTLPADLRYRILGAAERAVFGARWSERNACAFAASRWQQQEGWHASPEAAIRARSANP